MSVVAIGVGVLGAGATIYGASQAGGGDAPMPMRPTPGKDLLGYIGGLEKGLPRLTQLEGDYRPQFGELNIEDQQQYLNALLGMSSQATGAATDQIQTARDSEYANMRQNTGNVLGILGGIDPIAQRMTDNQAQMADERYQSARNLNPQEQRMVQQGAREAFVDRGRLNDNASVAAELLDREEMLRMKREEAQRAGGQAMAMSQQQTSPALSLLGMNPAGLALGTDLLGGSQGIIGKNTPSLINPDAGINMGIANANNMNSYMQAQAANKANSGAAWTQAGAALLGTAAKLY